MFNQEFFPTPFEVIERMTEGMILENKTILEPSAGKGDIVDFLNSAGANVLACELNKDLQKIVQTKCKLLAEDFLTVTSDQISHIDAIIMNPPFSNAVEHILHAYNIAPKGCKIVALCNASNLENLYTNSRKELKIVVDNYGQSFNLGNCFEEAERKTGVTVSMLTITKPGESYKSEFEGFFTDEEPEEAGEIGLMSYNVVRDLVNRYVAAVKLYDEHLNTGIKMNNLLSNFYGEGLTFTCTEKGAPKLRNDFKKDLQRAGWKFIFNKMDMNKYMTKGLKEDINKFVEQQIEIPFTMRNIYHMLDMVVQTHGQRMDKAILEVFDKITKYHADNCHLVEGWKTNSHFLLTKKFIHPGIFRCGCKPLEVSYREQDYQIIDDLHRVLCYMTGKDFDEIGSFWGFNHVETEQSKINKIEGPKSATWYRHTPTYEKHEFNKWYEFGFFRVKGFKKGTGHFEFKDEELWGKFNQRVAKLKGYPLFEGKAQTKYQDRQTGRAQQQKANPAHAYKPTVLFEIKVA